MESFPDFGGHDRVLQYPDLHLLAGGRRSGSTVCLPQAQRAGNTSFYGMSRVLQMSKLFAVASSNMDLGKVVI